MIHNILTNTRQYNSKANRINIIKNNVFRLNRLKYFQNFVRGTDDGAGSIAHAKITSLLLLEIIYPRTIIAYVIEVVVRRCSVKKVFLKI